LFSLLHDAESIGLDVLQWIGKARNALVVFTNALAYNPQSKKVESMTWEDCQVAVARWPFLGEPILPYEADQRALGLISPFGEPCDLPDVTLPEPMAMDAWLIEDMIEGAMLPNLPWPTNFHPTIQVSHCYLVLLSCI
jgi:hypothetical protein